MTVLQALTLAGGATERGSAGRAKVVRIVGGKKVETKVKPTDLVAAGGHAGRARALLLSRDRARRSDRACQAAIAPKIVGLCRTS